MRMVLAILTVFVLSMTTPSTAADPTVSSGRLDFDLPDLDGNLVSSKDDQFADKVVYVTAWATWCPPCLSEIPTRVDLQRQFRDRGLVVVGIAFEQEGERRIEKLAEFCSTWGVNYLVLDGGSPDDFATALPGVDRVKGLPIEFLIDRSGQVVVLRNSRGQSRKWATRLEREIVGLLGESE